METVTCNCGQYYRNIESSQCPSPGCNEFIQFMKTYFKVQTLDNLNWGFLDSEDLNDSVSLDRDPFIVGPRNQGTLHKSKSSKSSPATHLERMLASNLSQTIDGNSTLVSIVDKKSLAHQGSRKAVIDSSGVAQWKLYKCKECQVWTHAYNESDSRFAILLNNRVKESRSHYVNVRSLNNAVGLNVRVPILQKI